MNNPSPSVTDQTSSSSVTPVTEQPRKKRGFAAMNADQVRELARRGGVAAHRSGTAHEFTSEEARAAGRKGGLATHSPGRKLATDAQSSHELNAGGLGGSL